MQKQKKQVKNQPYVKHSFIIVSTNDCLKIDKNKINFCKYPIFASSSKQINTTIQLLDYFADFQKKDFHMLRLKTNTTNVALKPKNRIFTIKAVQAGQESTQLQIPIKAGDSMQVIIRANIPQLQVTTDINGQLTIQIDDFAPMVIPIASRGQVPQIICMKQMQNLKTGMKIIKIPSKKQMKIPFKNSSNINFFFQLKLLSKDLQKPDYDGVKLRIVPSQPLNPKFQQQKNKGKDLILKVDANSAFCVILEFQLLRNDNSIRVARRLLILQVQGTKLIFPFPLQVIISQ